MSMKKLFLLPATLLALASCSNDSVVEQNPSKVVEQNALQIYPAIANATRGTVWDNSNFTSFKLTTSQSFQTDDTTPNSTATDNETKTFSGETITKDTDGSWYFEGKKVWYWPSKSASSSFTAWAPFDAAGSYTANNADLDELQDIVVAYNYGSAADFASGVPLKFRHITSQIVVMADNAAANKVKIEVKGVRLNNIKNGGTWKLPTASTADALGYDPWVDENENLTVQGGANYVASCTQRTLTGTAADITGDKPLLLLPQQWEKADIGAAKNQYLSVLVKITDAADATKLIYPKNNAATHGGDFAWAAVDINTKWEPGKKYIYTLHFTEGGYGKIDKNTEGGNDDPGDNTPDDDDDDGDNPKPGEDIQDAPVKLVLDVTVVNWDDITESQDM